jgi:hypothetical protein
MTTRFAEFLAQDGGSALSARSYMRIAVPSWRFVGIRVERKVPESKPSGLSREEIQSLFLNDLHPRSKARLTELEAREKELQKKIRDALYSDPLTASPAASRA